MNCPLPASVVWASFLTLPAVSATSRCGAIRRDRAGDEQDQDAKAPAAHGHATAALPSPAMNSRRRTSRRSIVDEKRASSDIYEAGGNRAGDQTQPSQPTVIRSAL